MVDHINNGEEGYSVRGKLNEVIDRTNTLNGIENQVEANKNLSQQNKARIDQEVQDRIEGDQALQDQVNDLSANKSDKDHQHQISDIDGLQEDLDGKQPVGDYVTEAPADGYQYGRQLQGGVMTWTVNEGGAGGGAGAGMIISAEPPAPEDREPGLQWMNENTGEIWIWDGVRWLEFPASGQIGPQGIQGEKGEKGDKGDPGDGTDVDLTNYVTEAPKDTKQYARQDGDWSELVIPDGGSSVHIGEAPPADPEEGQQWLETPAGGDAKMWIYDGAVWLEQPSGSSGATVGTSSVMLEPDARNTLPPGLATQKDVNLYLSGALDKLLDEEGNPIGGGDDSRISNQQITNWDEAHGWGDHAQAGYLTDFTELDPTVPQHVKNITTTNISHWDQAWEEATEANGWGNHAEAGYLTEFTETDPTVPAWVKSITEEDIAAWSNGDAGGISGELDPDFEYGDPWKGDIENPGPMWVVQDGGLSASWIQTDNHLSAKTASFRTVKAMTVDTHAPFYGSVSTAAGFFTEATIFGGINITALDQERPEELPFDLSDEDAESFKSKTRSIQHALTVTHETLGRTVEIDKEGIIRANAFTDMEGNPIGGGGGEIDDSDFVKLNDDNVIGSEFYLRNDDWTFAIDDGEVFSKAVAGYNIFAGGTGYRSKDASLRVEDHAFQVIDIDGTNSMHITHGGVVQAQGYLDADGNPATVSPSSIVEAFTTLQTAVADEDTLEGVKSALTNSLGGLIEKFEGMQNV